MDEIFANLKVGRTEYELEYKRYRPVKGNKRLARDTAFKLLYLILLGQFKDETKDSAKVFNAVLFVVSHSGTFKYRTRSMIRAAYEERFILSTKQRDRLDQWEKGEAAKQAADEDGDASTNEAESDYDFWSDDSF